ncbi:MAG: DUF6122 family protein [Pseudohongiellaceae bacterium]
MLHISLHILAPLLIAGIFYRPAWLKCYVLLLLGLSIDLDHLLATPIYDPNRCSIGFHPMHTLFPILFYIALMLPKKSRIIGVGLCLHIILDLIDCQVNGSGLCVEDIFF